MEASKWSVCVADAFPKVGDGLCRIKLKIEARPGEAKPIPAYFLFGSRSPGSMAAIGRTSEATNNDREEARQYKRNMTNGG